VRFQQTSLRGVFVIEPEAREDERGFLACSWNPEEFAAHGLTPQLAQCNITFNKRTGTIRGMHFQMKPHEQAKLVRCTRGAIYDVAVDLRVDSPTRYQWVSVELSADNHKMLYLPEGCAHGYQTLEDNSESFYQMSVPYHPESLAGVRWDDPAFGIKWPLPVSLIIERDANYPLIQESPEVAREVTHC
jgi:dTDP-4-dehydrorhamnose 3,5-epimerase